MRSKTCIGERAEPPVQKEARTMPAAMTPSAAILEPIQGDEFSTRVGAIAAPVFNNDKMCKFVALMGSEWVTRNLRKFAIDVERRLASLDTATSSELAAISHGMIMMAANGGFMELLDVCEGVQREARQGAGLDRVAELRAAGQRALAIMQTYSPRP